MHYLCLPFGVLPRAANGGLFVSAGYGMHPRRVIDSYELIFMRQGRLELAEAGRVFALAAGDLLLLLPGREHWGVTGYDQETSFYWLHFYLPEASVRVVEQNGRPEGALVIPQHSHPPAAERIVELLRRFLHRQEEGFYCPMEADLLAGQLLLEWAYQPDESGVGRSAKLIAAQARECIDEQFTDGRLTPGEVAGRLQFNPDYLGRIFKQVYRQTLGEYLNQKRLGQARRLLLETQWPIGQIAAKVGYADAGYFRRLFKKKYDLTAVQWRRLHCRGHINRM